MTTHKCEWEKEIKESHSEVFGNGKKGLKYDYLEFKTSMKTRMNIFMMLFSLQFAASMGILLKFLVG